MLFNLTARYMIFACLATLSNLAVQRCIFWIGPDNNQFLIALISGTTVGLLVKYLFDKYFIFKRINQGISKSAKEFFLYSITGSVTTLLFWGTEATFWWVWPTHEMRELGAILGLIAGYIIKFHIDKKIVFNDNHLRGKS